LLSAAIDAGMVEALTAKVTAWENERGNEFLYDGVSGFLLINDLFYTIIKSASLHKST